MEIPPFTCDQKKICPENKEKEMPSRDLCFLQNRIWKKMEPLLSKKERDITLLNKEECFIEKIPCLIDCEDQILKFEKLVHDIDEIFNSRPMYYKDKKAKNKKMFICNTFFDNDAMLTMLLQMLHVLEEKQNKSAQYLLGIMYESDENFKKAKYFYEKAAKQGHLNALYELGRIKKSVDLLKEAYKQGHPLAAMKLGKRSEKKGNWEAAIEYYKFAFNQGCMEAAQPLIDYYSKMNQSLERDYSERFYEYYEKIPLSYFDQEDAEVLEQVGNCYNLSQDIEKALFYFKIADKLGSIHSLLKMGVIYKELGENSKALEYYKRAYKLGHKEAAVAIGNIYNEWGDYNKALTYYTQVPNLNLAGIRKIMNKPPCDPIDS